MKKSMIITSLLLLFSSVIRAQQSDRLETHVAQASFATGIGNNDAPVLYFSVNVPEYLGSVILQELCLKFSAPTKSIKRWKVYRTNHNYGLKVEGEKAELLATIEPTEGEQNIKLLPRSLPTGKHFFWITADVSKKAHEGDLIDAEIISYTYKVKEGREEKIIVDGNPDGATQVFLTESVVAFPWTQRSKYWRIPAITTAKRGRLVAVMDKRWESNYDLPNNIDVATCYSDDNGRTWSEPKIIAGTEKLGGDYGHGDPGIVYNRRNGDLLVFVVSKEGFFQSTPEKTARLKLIVSHDNGVNWEAPRDITDDIYGVNCPDAIRSKWNGCFVASGAMAQTKDGCLMAVMCVLPTSEKKSIDNYVIYSDDDGQHWQVCPSRVAEGGDESKIVELTDGRLLVSVRHRGGRFFSIAEVGADGTMTFGSQQLRTDLEEPACNGDLIRYPSNKISKRPLLLHTICHYPNDRRNVSVFLSEDEGLSWPSSRTICPGRSAYSALTVLKDGTIGCFYEDDSNAFNEEFPYGSTLRFVRFSLDWIKAGGK